MAESLTAIGTLNVAESSVTLGLAGMGGVAIQIQGTFTGTITFEATVQGMDFAPFRVVPSNSSTAVTTATTTGLWVGSTVGYTSVRARMSAYTNGQATVLMRADMASPGGSSGGGGVGSDVNLIEVGGASIALGQAAMAASLPVVIASNQTAIPITGSITASNPSVGPTGDPVPVEATLIGYQEPAGDLEGFQLEAFDYDTGAGTQAQTAIGLVIPASGGPVPVGTSNPLPVSQATAANLNATVVGTGTFAAQVTGTVTANAGTNLNTSALALEATLSTLNGKVTAVNTGAVVVASSALPTGASTLSEQQTQTTALGTLLTTTGFNAAFGTAGTADAQVMSVQGIASMTPVQVSQATASNLNAQVVGSIADDATTPGNPVMVGGMAKSPDGTDPGSVSAENDVARAITDLNRRVFVNADHPRSLTKHLDGTSAYTDESIIADPGDGFQAVITNIIGSTGAATAMNFFLEEGSTKIFGPIYLEAVAGRGFCSGPMYLPCTASTAVTLTSSQSIAQSFQIAYFIQAV